MTPHPQSRESLLALHEVLRRESFARQVAMQELQERVRHDEFFTLLTEGTAVCYFPVAPLAEVLNE